MRKKFDDKSEKCIFIGYSEKIKANKLFNPKTKKIVISRDVRVDEDSSFDEKDPVKLLDFVDEEIEESDDSSQPSNGDFSPKRKMKSLQEIYNSTEQVETNDSIFFAFFASEDPISFDDANKEEKWQQAIVMLLAQHETF